MKASTISIYALLLVVLMVTQVYGQQKIDPMSDTVRWTYGNGENKVRSEQLSISGQIISFGSRSMVWRQNGTDRVYEFIVTAVKGSWEDTDQDGELIFQANCGGIDGTVRIFRDKKQIGVHIDFAVLDKLSPNVLLGVTTITKI
jgi:hypothetical protein